jgi:hypothetical protein
LAGCRPMQSIPEVRDMSNLKSGTCQTRAWQALQLHPPYSYSGMQFFRGVCQLIDPLCTQRLPRYKHYQYLRVPSLFFNRLLYR